MKIFFTLALIAANITIMSGIAFPQISCEATVEIITPRSGTGPASGETHEMSVSARWLLDAVHPHSSERWQLLSSRTFAFPPEGEVRFISLPSSYIDAVELRNLPDHGPESLSLTHGHLQGAPTPCPPRYFKIFSTGPLSDGKSYEVVTTHRSGPIEPMPPPKNPIRRPLPPADR